MTIEALKLLPERNRPQFIVLGDGPYRQKLEAMSDDNVLFLGTRKDIKELLSQADIFIHVPEWEEGFGITVVEAMAAGKVCIVANSGALPEIITNGVNGYIVEKENVEMLASMIQTLSNNIDTPEVKRIKSNAIERAMDFSMHHYLEDLDRLINNI